MTTKTQNFYEVGYTHKSGSIGAMGKKHTTIEEAKEHIEYLKSSSKEQIYNKDREYFITHNIIVTSFERIKL